MREFDKSVSQLSTQNGLEYSRYADDLFFSSRGKSFSRDAAQHFIQKMYQQLLQFGFEANRTKTTILPPSARKIVLGLLVDRNGPRLTKQFRSELETHAYYLSSPEHGPLKHSNRRGFTSVIGLQNYVNGLMAHAAQVDPEFAKKVRLQMSFVKWPI
jgi:RNA-directed DNA polymerase